MNSKRKRFIKHKVIAEVIYLVGWLFLIGIVAVNLFPGKFFFNVLSATRNGAWVAGVLVILVLVFGFQLNPKRVFSQLLNVRQAN